MKKVVEKTKKTTKTKTIKKEKNKGKVMSKAKKEKVTNKKIEKNENEGMFSKSGDWNGSTMSDNDIKNIKNEREKDLCQRLDKLQEEIKEARENGEDRDIIANMVIECSRIRQQLNEINHQYMDM